MRGSRVWLPATRLCPVRAACPAARAHPRAGLVDLADETQAKVEAPTAAPERGESKRVKFNEENVQVITIESPPTESDKDGIHFLSKEERSSAWAVRAVAAHGRRAA